MGAPFARGERRERPREWLKEAYILATQANIPDPLSLPVPEFNGWLEAVADGAPVRGGPIDARSYVDSVVRGGVL